MAGRTVVRVQGLRELRRRLRRIEGGLDDLKAEHAWVADYVGGKARPATPYRTGRLYGTGRASGTKTNSIVRYGRASAPYAAVIHYGWPDRGIRPQTWVIDAAQRSEPIWAAHFNATIADLVERTPA